MKKVVHWRPTKDDFIEVGARALLFNVIDHPNKDRVSNRPDNPVSTSGVIKIINMKDGQITKFETENTIYLAQVVH